MSSGDDFRVAAQAERRRARFAQLLGGTGAGVHVVKATRRTVTVTVGQSDFYAPEVAVGRALAAVAEREVRVREVRHVASSEVRSAPPSAMRAATTCVPRAGSKRYWRTAMRYLRSVVGDEQLARYWERVRGEIFFMMSDRVLLVKLERDGHWTVTRVPEEGLSS